MDWFISESVAKMVELNMNDYYWKESRANSNQYISLMKDVIGSFNSDYDVNYPGGEKNDKAHPYSVKVIIDPSGYVYEGEPENFITVDGRKISGQWEAESEGDYSRRFIFYPEKRIGSDTVVLNVNGTLRSKAGVMVGADFTRELKVEEEITSIDLSESIRIPYGEAAHIEILFEPAATANGKWMHVEVESEEIFKPFVKDVLIENGKAVISLYGNLPGASNIMISVDDSYTKAESEVEVVGMIHDHTPMPTSSLPDMSVITPETDIKLFCADKTAAIRYTVDGTDPLSSANAVDYLRNEAIHLSQNTVLKAVAISEENGASDTAVFNYIISTFAVDEIKATDCPIQYKDGTIYCDGAKRIAVFNLEGRKVVEKAATEVSLNKLSRGIYIAAAYNDNGLSILKIKK